MRTLKRNKVAVLLALLVLAISTLIVLGYQSRHSSKPFAFWYEWPVGTRYTYSLDWRSRQQGKLPFGTSSGSSNMALSGVIDLNAQLVLRSLEQLPDGFIIGASIAEVSRHQVDVFNQALLPDAQAVHTAFDGQEALLEVGRRGDVRAIRFDPSAPEIFKNAMQWLATEAQLVLPENGTVTSEGSWVAVESSTQGRARVQYSLAGRDPPRLVRQRLAYDSLNILASGVEPHELDSHAECELDPSGHLRSFRQTETLIVHQKSGAVLLDSVSSLSLELLSVGKFQPPPRLSAARETEVRHPGEIAAGSSGERNLLLQRADGITIRQVRNDILQHGKSGKMPEHSRWLWRATGLLLLEPERCRELVAIFDQTDLGSRGRELILDLLAFTGTSQAQEAMRQILDSPAARHSVAEHTRLLQRLSFLSEPSTETVEFVAHRYANSDEGPERFAAAYTLGATLGQLKEKGEPALFESSHRQLVEGLNAAKGREAESIHLRALGNAGLDKDVDLILQHSHSEAPEVRQSAAAALRKTDTAEATKGLLMLVGDGNWAVQAEALSSLETRTLNAEVLTDLNQLVQDRKIDVTNLARLVNLLEKQRAREVIPADMLRGIARQIQGDPGLATRVRQMLARLGS